MKTYQNVIDQIENSPCRLSVAVSFHQDRPQWLPVDKVEYVNQLRLIDNLDIPFPVWLETEPDGDMYIHPKWENH